MSTLPLRPLGFGEILDGALQLYRENFGLYYLIALAATVPGYVFLMVSGVDVTAASIDAQGDPLTQLPVMLELIGILLAAAVIGWVGWVAVTAAMAKRIADSPMSFGSAYADAFRNLPSAAGATVLALVIFGFVLIAFSTMFGILAAVASGVGGVVVAILVGSLLLLLGILVFCLWMGATFGILPAVVIEGRGPISALGRSFSLCRGGWLRVTGIMVVAMIIYSVPSLGVTALFGMGNIFTSPEALGELSSTQHWLLNTVDLVVGPLPVPFVVGSTMMLFHDRKVRSEAFDLEVLAGKLDTT